MTVIIYLFFSAQKEGKPWPSLCATHPRGFACDTLPNRKIHCDNVQTFLLRALQLDPANRITAKEALEMLQSFK